MNRIISPLILLASYICVFYPNGVNGLCEYDSDCLSGHCCSSGKCCDFAIKYLGIIIGVSVGVIILIIKAIVVTIWCCCYRKRNQQTNRVPYTTSNPYTATNLSPQGYPQTNGFNGMPQAYVNHASFVPEPSGTNLQENENRAKYPTQEPTYVVHPTSYPAGQQASGFSQYPYPTTVSSSNNTKPPPYAE